MFRLGMTEGVPIESGMISRKIEGFQKSVEAQNFDARKHLLEYDDVMNKQRETIYAIRRSALEGKDQRDYVLGIAEDVARELVETYCPASSIPISGTPRNSSLNHTRSSASTLKLPAPIPRNLATTNYPKLPLPPSLAATKKRKKQFTPELMRWLERRIILDVVTRSGKTTCSRSTT